MDDPEFVELLPEVEPVEFTLLLVLLSFLSFLDFLLFLSVLDELMLRSLLLVLEFVLLLGELTPGLVELPAVPDDPAVWPIAKGLRLIERAGTSKKASLFFMLLAPLERRLLMPYEEQILRHCAQARCGWSAPRHLNGQVA